MTRQERKEQVKKKREKKPTSVVVELDQLALVDSPDTELSLHGGDQGGSLEESTSQGLESTRKLGLAAGNLVVEANNSNIFLSGTLLGLDETSSAVNANNQTTRNLGVERSTVAGLLASQNTFYPSDNFVTGGVGGFVEINDTGGNVGLEVS